jgi:peptidoglycan/LPS O-acetylase OafA/YrhL
VENAKHSLPYRRDIDGLRAFAVLSVLFFHAESFGVPGGFIGVDIFFVISGFLITKIISDGLDAGTFSIATFYERRIRRIVPAFVAMVLVTTAASAAFLPPALLARFGQSAGAAAVFASNIFFSFHAGYFRDADEFVPLLHTWSLGIEEQFYILWPLAGVLLYRAGFRKPGTAILIMVGIAASLAVSEYGARSWRAPQMFYMLQSRAWELMLGAFLAMGVLPAANRWQREAVGIAGLALMAIPVMLFSSDTPFPGLHALVPCLGAAFILYSGQHAPTMVSRLLAWGPFVFIGLISYSLYLWHWPLFVFAKNYLERDLTRAEAVLAIVLSVGVATISWRFVERPFRYPAGSARQLAFAGGLGSLLFVAAIGMSLKLSNGLPQRLDSETERFYTASRSHNPLRRYCHVNDAVPAAASRCIEPQPSGGAPGYKVLMWGDSHADALFPAAVAIAQQFAVSARQTSKSGCPPLLNVSRVGTASVHCREFNDAVMRMIAADRPKLVILAARWSQYVRADPSGKQTLLIDEHDQTADVETSRKIMARSLALTLKTLEGLGVAALVVGQAPEFPWNPNVCFVQRRMYHRDATECLREPQDVTQKRLEVSTKILLAATSRVARAALISSEEIFCKEGNCVAERNGQPLYQDNHHLGREGAVIVGALASQNLLVKEVFSEARHSFSSGTN